ncbi:hypothetical protein ACFL3G_11825 [Planctomycetota bacterium]
MFSRKGILVIILTLAWINMAIAGDQLHESVIELKFEIATEKQPWMFGGNSFGKGPIKPTHVAEIFIRNMPKQKYESKSGTRYRSISKFSDFAYIKTVLDTRPGRSISQQQRDLVTTGNVIRAVGKFGDVVGNHGHFYLYAVSADDAKKITAAFMESLISKVHKNLEPLLSERDELKKKTAEHEKKTSETEAKLETLEKEFAELKKSVHYLSAEEARNSITKLNVSIAELDINLAAMRAKHKAAKRSLPGGESNIPKELKLEQKITVLTTELQAARTVNKTAITNRNRTISRLKTAEDNFDKLKNIVHEFSDSKTKHPLLEIYKIVDEIGSLIAEIRSELVAANEADKSGESELDMELKAEQKMRSEIFELEAAQARRETAVAAREQAERFYHLGQQISDLESSKKSLSEKLETSAKKLTEIEEKLANPGPELLAPEVYQNKATIYQIQNNYQL